MRTTIATASALLIFASVSFGYIRTTTNLIGDTSPAPLFRTDNNGIQFYLNSQVVAGVQSSASGKNVTVITASSNPLAATRAAMASWNASGVANVTFLPLQPTNTGINSSDGTMVVAIGASANDLSLVGGALAVTSTSYVTSSGVLPNGTSVNKGQIVDSDIIINPEYSFSTDGSANTYDLQATLLHEFGHSLGANHSGLIGASMFQYPTGRFLSADDLTFAQVVYPASGKGTALGTISGSVTAAGAGVPYALLTAFDTSTGITVGGVTNPDGTWSFQVPAGNYQIYAEPLNGVTAINLYLTQAQLNQATSIAYQTTLFGGTVSVTAGSTATANIAVTPGAATLAPIYVAASVVNGNPGAGSPSAPVILPSGQSMDLVFAGAGFDASLANGISIYGKGISLQAGSVRVDKSASLNGYNLLRATVNIAATSTPSLGSIVISNGANTISLSGILTVVPSTPAFVSAGVISAAAYVGIQGGVSPGGIYTIYAGTNASVGPASGVNNGGYDAYGLLPTTLGGVSVTFDGVPAPMYYVGSGQVNLQVPFEVAGKTSTKVAVNYLGSASTTVTVPVIAVQPLFFTFDGKAVIAVNQDGTVNTAQNAAARGTYVTVFGTGLGKLNCTVATGQGAPSASGSFCQATYTYSIGGSATAPAAFAGWTPTAVGLAQWNLQIPSSSSTGTVPIVVTDSSGASSFSGSTIYVK